MPKKGEGDLKILKRLTVLAGRTFDLITTRPTMAAADIAGVLILLMAVAIGVDVFLRYVFNAPTIWINESARYTLLIITFLGLAYTRKENAHIRVDFIIKRLPRYVQNWMRVIDSVCFLVFTVVLFSLTWHVFMGSVERGTLSPSFWQVPIAPWQAFIPLGLAVLGLLLIRNIFTETKAALRKSEESDDKSEQLF
ncbi:MAG: TRAP transporter small permease [Dehalococcoidales bacterium]